MSSNKDRFRIAADIPKDVRARLMNEFYPRYAKIFCSSITWAYGVPLSFDFPRHPMQASIYGHHLTEQTEAFVLTLDDDSMRPDGQRLFLTLSVADPLPPHKAGEIDADAVTYLDEPIAFQVRLQRFPLWQMSYTQA